MARAHRNPEKMFLIIEQWELSGLTQGEFCQSQGIPESTFYYWHRKYKEEKAGFQNSFIPVTIKNEQKTASDQSTLTISYPNGVQISLSGRLTTDYIRELIHIF